MAEAQKFAPKPNGAGEMFQLFRDGNSRTRAELTALTGQSRSTVAARLEVLTTLGLIGPAGEANSTGGRPPAVFAFTTDVKLVLAVDLGATHVGVAVTDLAANILEEHYEPCTIADGPEPVLARVAELGEQLIEKAGRDLSELAAVGIGLPGPVDHWAGRPINPPIMPGWDDVDVPGILGAHLGVPVMVDNDVNIMALGEHAKAHPDVDHLLFVKVATGIGAGVIMDGELRRGARGAAGDMGHVAVLGGEKRLCRCGNYGCLEAVASGVALVEDLSAEGLEVEDLRDVVEEIRRGDLRASAAARDAGRQIGEVLATCVSLFNPSLIVIGGIISEAGNHLLAGIREVVYRRSLPLATQQLRIATTEVGSRAGIYGASVMAAEQVLSVSAIENAITQVVNA